MDIVKSVQSTLYERIVSPLSGVFIVSWSVFHYELVMMLMSDLNMQAKTQYIYEWMVVDAYNNWGDSNYLEFSPYYYGLARPLAYSFCALLLYSFFSVPAYGISMTGKYCLQRIRRFYDEVTPVAAKAFVELQTGYEVLKSSSREKSIKYEAEIDRYRSVGAKLSAEVEELKTNVFDLNAEADDVSGKMKKKNDELLDTKEKLSLKMIQAEEASTKLLSVAERLELISNQSEKKDEFIDQLRQEVESLNNQVSDLANSKNTEQDNDKGRLPKLSDLVVSGKTEVFAKTILSSSSLDESSDLEYYKDKLSVKSPSESIKIKQIIDVFRMNKILMSMGASGYILTPLGQSLKESLERNPYEFLRESVRLDRDYLDEV